MGKAFALEGAVKYSALQAHGDNALTYIAGVLDHRVEEVELRVRDLLGELPGLAVIRPERLEGLGRIGEQRFREPVRERIGRSDEEITPPASVANVEDLMVWLTRRGEEYAHAFENPKVIRVAIDQNHVKHNAPIAGAREIAFFPPMTGG